MDTVLGVISKELALSENQKWYFTGVPCKNGHISRRYCNTGVCYACHSENNLKYFKLKNDLNLKKRREYYQTLKQEGKLRKSDWAKRNKDKSHSIDQNVIGIIKGE